ncbi:mitochondrial carrier domain-containing protein [Panaeolus papilionaceus]|nr:mitochondrial carrier domain-containing protein [Panaeolus papilionaceus]
MASSSAFPLIAGSVGGAAQVLVGRLLDTITMRAQIAPSWLFMFAGPMDILKQTLRNEGFYCALQGPLIGIAGVNSLLFASYGISKRIISPYPQLNCIGRSCGRPVEMFKVRMQGQYGAATDKKLLAVVGHMWRDWGFKKGIMRGYWVTVAREIPAYTGLRIFQSKFSAHYGKDLPVWALLASGSTGGRMSCYPLDVVKSPIQLRATPPTGTPVHVGLFRGFSPSCITCPPCMFEFAR